MGGLKNKVEDGKQELLQMGNKQLRGGGEAVAGGCEQGGKEGGAGQGEIPAGLYKEIENLRKKSLSLKIFSEKLEKNL